MRNTFSGLLVLVVALALAGTAVAATAPSASTGPVTTVGPTTATVSGSVNPNGTATSWTVEYGTSTGYGTKTSAVSAGAGTTSAAVSASLGSLKPGTTYHYRFVATSSAGTGHGADGILTTSSAPAAVTGSVSGVTPTSANLNGTVDPTGRPTAWYFEYGTSTRYGKKTTAKDAGSGNGATPVSAAVTGLATGRLYHYRLVATSDAGTSNGADQTFAPVAAPTVTTKPASGVGDTSATVNGTVDPNGEATSVAFEYGTTTSYGSKTAVKSAGSGTSAKSMSAALTGLAGGTTYHFRIVAANGAGTTPGADLLFTTSGKPIPRTGAPGAVTGISATLTGTVDPAGHSTSWYFEFGTTVAYGTKTASQGLGSSPGEHSVSVPIAALRPGTTYHVRLVAANSSGTSYGADATFATVGPVVTLSASSSTVVHGHRVTLRGRVGGGQSNEHVSIYASRNGGTFTGVATLLSGPDGTWAITVKPPIRTTYKALFGGGSAVTTVFVRPAVAIRAESSVRFATHVVGLHSFKGRVVQLQRRRSNGRWVTIARTRLGTGSKAVFRPLLPRGRSVLRVAIGSGKGYLAGYSRAIAFRRR